MCSLRSNAGVVNGTIRKFDLYNAVRIQTRNVKLNLLFLRHIPRRKTSCIPTTPLDIKI